MKTYGRKYNEIKNIAKVVNQAQLL